LTAIAIAASRAEEYVIPSKSILSDLYVAISAEEEQSKPEAGGWVPETDGTRSARQGRSRLTAKRWCVVVFMAVFVVERGDRCLKREGKLSLPAEPGGIQGGQGFQIPFVMGSFVACFQWVLR